MSKETKCTCERPDDNTCNYCEQQSSIQILEQAAERIYPISGPNSMWNSLQQDGFIAGAKWQQERMYSEEDMIEFGEWMKILPLTVSGFVIKDKNIVIKKTKELLKYWFENFNKK